MLSPQRNILLRTPENAAWLDVYGNPVQTPAIVDGAMLFLQAEDPESALEATMDQVVSAPPSPFRTITDLGDSWRQTYMGRLNDKWWPWLEHREMGRLYGAIGTALQDLFIYDFTLGRWWYQRSTTFPWIYDVAADRWIFYARGTASPHRFFWLPGDRPGDGQWVHEADLSSD